MRDQIVDFVRGWSEKTEIHAERFIKWLGIAPSKFYSWRRRYGCVNEHNGWVPRDFWLEEWEKQAIFDFYREHPLQGYRRLTFMMLDADIVAVSPSSVWRVLSRAGLLRKWNGKTSLKGTGFQQPLEPHQHWHIDVSYINISGTFYYLCSVLDGYSRAIVHWDLREAMREADVEIILEAAKEKYPDAKPRIISDNGPQFIAKDFKEFISCFGNDTRENIALLSAIERQVGALAQVVEERMYPAGCAADARGCAAADRALCRALQHGASAQRDRVRDAGGHAGGTTGGDSRRARPQAGAGAAATSATLSAGGLSFGVTMAMPGETEAGSAGKQPCRGIARRAHRDDDHGRGNERLAPTLHPIGSIDPDALKIPARRAASTLTRSPRSPVPAEPAHYDPRVRQLGQVEAKEWRLDFVHRRKQYGRGTLAQLANWYGCLRV